MSDYALLAEGGSIAQAIPDFEPRPQQQAMAAAVARAIAGQHALLCEAGTGTGKTLAYLAPALEAGVRVIISTGTRNLQDQLFGQDLPMLREALGQPAKVVALKGRSNYLCLHRLDQAERQGTLDTDEARQLTRIRRWAGLTTRGDLAELTTLADDDPARRLFTSTPDNCLGQECPRYAECHVLKARRAALDADIVVVNHHLYFADMALREEGFGELLPDARAVIFDEAHQLPEVATRFFGWNVSAGQLREFADDAVRAVQAAGGDRPAAERAAAHVREGLTLLRAALPRSTERMLWEGLRERADIAALLRRLRTGVKALAEVCDVGDGGGDLSSCLRRAITLSKRLQSLEGPGEAEQVRWVETHARGLTWRAAPLEVAELFGEHLRTHPVAWIFTSATLAVDGSFAHFADRMGITDYESHVWESPFDYMHQALCYLPVGLPEPRGAEHTEALLAQVLPLLEAGGGRAFVLFTSHRALRHAAGWLSERIRFPLLVQGQAPKVELVRRFIELGNCVLLGTSSFWEGVDVRGDALQCVVIDKLPFASPDDPVLEARLKALREEGRDPFREFQLPLAVIALKQGAGRLIRSRRDRGVLVLGNPRLVSRGYGRLFLRSLPTMPITQDPDAAVAFLAPPAADDVVCDAAMAPGS